VPQRGPAGPNFYDELRREMAEEGRAVADETQPADNERGFRGLRADNEELVANNAAALSEERLAERHDEVFSETAETTAKQVDQVAELRDVRNRFDSLGQSPVDLVEERYLERHGGKPNPNDPYLKALQDDAGDPYETLRRAAIADDAAFTANYERYSERIENAETPDARRSLEQQQRVYAEDHLAEVDHRIADVEEITTGSRDSGEEWREQARAHEEEAKKTQDSYRLRTGRDARADGLSDDALAQHESSGSRESSGSEGLSSTWSGAGDEVTDRLDELESRFPDSPSRPNDTGGRSY
jgi:hypothetical protein